MVSKSLAKRMKELNREMDKLRNEMTKESKKAFKSGVKELFSQYPNLNSFAWTQYTPYFNDGDECIFGAYTDCVFLNGDTEALYPCELETLLDHVNNKEKTIKKLRKEIEDSKNDKYESSWRKEYNEAKIKEIEESNPDEVKEQAKMIRDIVDFLQLIDSDTLRDMFGDHVMVTVSRDGIDTESYEHD
jgi:hypothetical protein